MPSRNANPIEQPTVENIDLSSILVALSEPVRLGIVAALASHDGDVACGTFDLPVAKSTSSHHFKVLRESGVMHQYDEGTRRLNRLRRADLDARFPGLLDLIIAEGRQVVVPIIGP
ncbi:MULTISPECIES: ArsR/SmtB family transcription factor [Subtercola]|uniref:ArsR/SmtB family transcription factor n=1 Tax=Subtercola TaxID=120212 RepID=UPI001F26399D|nr:MULTISPECIES: helix-turn-helix transcriptional regulator [Subtercola]MEA9986906.1 helix-turn-helix transcriptional regulator [Subtercola sp. RTI3]